MERLIKLYNTTFNASPEKVEKLEGAGSNRAYYRLWRNGQSVIGVIGTSKDENNAFTYLSEHFRRRGINVPEVYSATEDGICYLQEDLGTSSLFELIKTGREAGGEYDEEEIRLLHKTISYLPKIQFEGALGLDFTRCYPQDSMDTLSVMFDLNYFKYCFLKLYGIEFNEFLLEKDFSKLASDLCFLSGETFLYRDFQARNVMIKDGEPYFIDFQGGRKGPIYYDVASFLWQASSHYSKQLRQSLIQTYLHSLSSYIQIDEEEFLAHLRLFVLFRTLQVLGAYGYRGLWEKKKHFIDSIPHAINNLSDCISIGTCDEYPVLKSVVESVIKKQKSMTEANSRKASQDVKSLLENDKSYSKTKDSQLVVRVYSFSYKKGIPADDSGNGGGYVFDCRAVHNPGRYQQYKSLTGLNKPVIDFLEEDGEMVRFMSDIYKLADFHVARYIERGFTNLMFSFGCTGGQHRSVYGAQHLAKHIHTKFGVEVILCHREQGIETRFA